MYNLLPSYSYHHHHHHYYILLWGAGSTRDFVFEMGFLTLPGQGSNF
jgi:hypothetical protein